MASSFVLWDSLRKFDSRSIYKSGSLPRPVIFSSDPLNPTGIHSYATATLTPRASISLTQKAGAKKREVTLTIKDGKGKKTISARSSARLAKVLAKAPRADLHATLFMRFSRLASTVGKANAQSSARDAPPALVTK